MFKNKGRNSSLSLDKRINRCYNSIINNKEMV